MRSMWIAPYATATPPASMRNAQTTPLKKPDWQSQGWDSGGVALISDGVESKPYAEGNTLSMLVIG